jgi:hypothetical protein
MENITARHDFIAQQPNEDAFELTIEIGAPYQDAKYPGEWLCPCAITPIYTKLLPARSDSSLQSLCLAICLVYTLASDFIKKGGTIRYDDGSDAALGAIFGQGPFIPIAPE